MAPQTGYLVGKDGSSIPIIFDGWRISNYLAERFGIRHFFLEPPIRVHVDHRVPQSKPLWESRAQTLADRAQRQQGKHYNHNHNNTNVTETVEEPFVTTAQKILM